MDCKNVKPSKDANPGRADGTCAGNGYSVKTGDFSDGATMWSKSLGAATAAVNAEDRCCQSCVLPLVKAYLVAGPAGPDYLHGYCQEACMDPKNVVDFQRLLPDLTLADSVNPCAERTEPDGTHYTEYYGTSYDYGMGPIDVYDPGPKLETEELPAVSAVGGSRSSCDCSCHDKQDLSFVGACTTDAPSGWSGCTCFSASNKFHEAELESCCLSEINV